ncbi:MAG: hypothetical protein QM296_10965, partial [Bacillota bacterium]|nr:hypothetical protein [Bacillota bacterium]
RNRGRNEKIVHGWTKKAVCAPKPGHKPRFLAKGGQKLRWCPEIGAGTKKLSTAGQKRPFVPRNLGTNPDFWPRVEKLRWCPEIGAGTKKLSTAGQKRPFVPRNLGTNPDFWPRVDKKCAAAPKPGQERKLDRISNSN